MGKAMHKKKKGLPIVFFLLVLLALLLASRTQQQTIQGLSVGDLSSADADDCGIRDDFSLSELFDSKRVSDTSHDLTATLSCILEKNKQQMQKDATRKNSFADLLIRESDKFKAEQEVVTALQTHETVSVIIWLNQDGKDLQNIKRSFFHAIPLQSVHEGTILPFLSGEIDLAMFTKIQLLKRDGIVDFIAVNHPIAPALVESRGLLGVPTVENQFGLTGKGIGVCVIDSGIDYTHPALGGCAAAQFLAGQCMKVVGGYDFCSTTSPNYPIVCTSQDADPRDEYGHGTHVGGIIASLDSQFKGISSGATLAAVKVLDNIGKGDIASLIAGIDWCVRNKDAYVLRVITMSLRYVQGAYSTYSPQTCPVVANPALNQALAAGFFIDAASGNDGSLSGISYPACAPGVVSVGSTNDANLGNGKNVDLISSFTNRDAFLDLLAPGDLLTAPASSQGFTCTTGGPPGFGICLGTSMAAPHVAGSAAILLERYPFLSAPQIETLLKQSGVPIVDPATQISYSRVNLLAALLSSGNQAPSLTLVGTPQRGKTVKIRLLDLQNPSRGYVLGLAFSNIPLTLLPDGRSIPLSPDLLFFATLTNPTSLALSNSFGVLDPGGFAEATWQIPSFVPPGTRIYASFFTVDFTAPFPQNILTIAPSIYFTVLP